MTLVTIDISNVYEWCNDSQQRCTTVVSVFCRLRRTGYRRTSGRDEQPDEDGGGDAADSSSSGLRDSGSDRSDRFDRSAAVPGACRQTTGEATPNQPVAVQRSREQDRWPAESGFSKFVRFQVDDRHAHFLTSFFGCSDHDCFHVPFYILSVEAPALTRVITYFLPWLPSRRDASNREKARDERREKSNERNRQLGCRHSISRVCPFRLFRSVVLSSFCLGIRCRKYQSGKGG